MEEDQGTPYALRADVIEEKQNMQMLVDKIWLSMPEMNRGPGYHTYHRTCSHLRGPRGFDKWTISTYKVKIVP